MAVTRNEAEDPQITRREDQVVTYGIDWKDGFKATVCEIHRDGPPSDPVCMVFLLCRTGFSQKERVDEIIAAIQKARIEAFGSLGL